MLNELDALLLDEKAPFDYIDSDLKKVPSVSSLLKKSTDLLDEETLNYFRCMGTYAPTAATLSLKDIKEVCSVPNPEAVVEKLYAHGLLECVNVNGRTKYQMHSLIVNYAKSLLEKSSDA